MLARKAETRIYRWYALVLLTVVYAFNIADRYVISTLIEPIKAELRLSDSAIGLLTGTALAIVYTGMGMPLARIADRGERRLLLVISIAVWSVMTAACGVASSFLFLLLARIGVGLGEAGATPASQSILADLFTFRERMPAMSIFALGAALGSMLGGAVGGFIGEEFGWRWAFLGLALPSVILAPLVWCSLHEPLRSGSLNVRADSHTVRELWRFALSQKALLHTLIGGAVCTFWSWGLLWWTPAFLARSYGFSTAQAGLLLGLINGIGGTVGVLLGGLIIHRLGLRDARRQCLTLAVIVTVATIASVIAYAVSNRSLMIVMMSLFIPVAYLYLAPAFGWIQSLAPARMRATFSAVFLFGANIANLALAPQLIGYGSDLLVAQPAIGQESLRWMLVATAFSGFWAAAHFWATGRTFRMDLERVGALANSTVYSHRAEVSGS
jgi:predicted MFS family arabinose efflux permease